MDNFIYVLAMIPFSIILCALIYAVYMEAGREILFCVGFLTSILLFAWGLGNIVLKIYGGV